MRVTNRNRRSPAPFGTLGLETFGSFGLGKPGRGRLTRRRNRARLRFFPSSLFSPVSPGAFLPSESPGSSALTNRRLYPARPRRAPVPPPLLRDVVDDQRNPLERVRLAQAVLEVERPVAGDQAPVVHLDREARRAPADLGRVVEAKPAPMPLRGRAVADDGVDQLVE